MARGKDREEIQRRWDLLIRASKSPISVRVVDAPFDVLERGGLSHAIAAAFLTILERNGYVKKHNYGGTRLVSVDLLKEKLGEDILGPEPKPTAKVGHPTKRKAVAPKDTEIASAPIAPVPASNAVVAGNGVLLLADWCNIMMEFAGNDKSGKVPVFPVPYEIFKNISRSYGLVVMSVAFVPPHISPLIQTEIFRHGFDVMSCPPVKDWGPDSVDMKLDEWGRLLLNLPGIRTLVIISNDKDFNPLKNFARDQGKNPVTVHLQYQNNIGVLITTDDNNHTYLAGSAPVGSPSIPSGENHFATVVNFLKDRGEIKQEDVKFLTLLHICLDFCGVAMEDDRKSLSSLASGAFKKYNHGEPQFILGQYIDAFKVLISEGMIAENGRIVRTSPLVARIRRYENK